MARGSRAIGEGAPAMPPISQAELERMLLDPQAPESTVRPRARLDVGESRALRPSAIADSAVADGNSPGGTAALGLLAQDEAALLTEIGRRAAIIRVSPEFAGAATASVLMPEALEAVGSGVLRELGSRIFLRLLTELHDVLCGLSGEGTRERDQLRNALGLGEAAMVAGISATLIAIGVVPLIAPLVAALVIKHGIDPSWEECCRLWSQQLERRTPSPEALGAEGRREVVR